MLKDLQKIIKMYPFLNKAGVKKASRVNQLLKGSPATADEADAILSQALKLGSKLSQLTKKHLMK